MSDDELVERRKMYDEQSGACVMVDMVRCDQMKCLMPKSFVEKNVGERIWNMKTKVDDIWIATYPKCGTTMTQELVWQMINLAKGGKLDNEMAKDLLDFRVPFLERSMFWKGGNPALSEEVPAVMHRCLKHIFTNRVIPILE